MDSCSISSDAMPIATRAGGGRYAPLMPDLKATLNGAAAGGAAAVIWALQQPVDKKVFDTAYDDASWPLAGTALHVGNGAVFGAVYAQLRPHLPGPLVARAVTMALIEHVTLWPLGRLSDRHHPARKELPALTGNTRAFAAATWRHFLFGAVLGELERRLNPPEPDEPPEIPVSSNGHGNIEMAVGAA